MAVHHLTKANFEREALQCDKPVLLEFYADWCGPCQMIAPLVHEIAEENDAYKVCKIDVDESPEIAAQYQVTVVPTLVVLKAGKVDRQSAGAMGKNAILNLLQ